MNTKSASRTPIEQQSIGERLQNIRQCMQDVPQHIQSIAQLHKKIEQYIESIDGELQINQQASPISQKRSPSKPSPIKSNTTKKVVPKPSPVQPSSSANKNGTQRVALLICQQCEGRFVKLQAKRLCKGCYAEHVKNKRQNFLRELEQSVEEMIDSTQGRKRKSYARNLFNPEHSESPSEVGIRGRPKRLIVDSSE